MDNYDDIRPYTDAEIPDAMRHVAEWDLFPQMARFIYPNSDPDDVRRRILAISTIRQFQSTVMNDAIRRIIAETTDGFTFRGLHRLRRNKPCLFVSNHRDITLDAFLLQHLLVEHRFDTSHIVFGQNLLAMPIIEVLFRSNKLIRMERGGTPRAFYNSLQHLSDYLNHLVAERHESVWIAQRNGRAKDGLDTTAPAMLKMLTLGGGDDPRRTLAELNLVPVSVSYEWDPCDTMKAAELQQKLGGTYHKAPDEDLKSVVTGIIGHKGHVHLEIGQPLTAHDLNSPDNRELTVHVAHVLDRRIRDGYRLMPTNYAAYDLLNNCRTRGRYTQHTLDTLAVRANALPHPDARRLLLEMYANPVGRAR